MVLSVENSDEECKISGLSLSFLLFTCSFSSSRSSLVVSPALALRAGCSGASPSRQATRFARASSKAPRRRRSCSRKAHRRLFLLRRGLHRRRAASQTLRSRPPLAAPLPSPLSSLLQRNRQQRASRTLSSLCSKKERSASLVSFWLWCHFCFFDRRPRLGDGGLDTETSTSTFFSTSFSLTSSKTRIHTPPKIRPRLDSGRPPQEVLGRPPLPVDRPAEREEPPPVRARRRASPKRTPRKPVPRDESPQVHEPRQGGDVGASTTGIERRSGTAIAQGVHRRSVKIFSL